MKTQNSPKATASLSKSNSKSEYAKGKKRAAKIRKELYDKWQHMERTARYLKAKNQEMRHYVSQAIESEVLDGIFIKLNDRNEDKSYPVKKRILRRIVEKRQAQAANRKYGKYNAAFVAATIATNTSQCMAHIERQRRAC